MALLPEGTLERLTAVVEISKTVFHYAFIPTVIYMGFKQGSDPGMPELSIANLFW